MGFIDIITPLFFVSLAITFVLIIMLVYHFKGRIIALESKCDTMFGIMNMIMQKLRTMQSPTQYENISLGEEIPYCMRREPPMEQIVEEDNESQEDDDDDDDESSQYSQEDAAGNFQKIVVSDTESVSIDEQEEENQPAKIIYLDPTELEIKEDEISVNELSVNENEEEVQIEEIKDDEEENESVAGDATNVEEHSLDEFEPAAITNEHLEKSLNYKKMDISYLRTMVITRGLATDTKKMKKSDLIKLLEES